MSAGNVHLTVEQGTQYQKVLRSLIDDVAVNLTNYHAALTVWSIPYPSPIVLELTDGSGDGLTLGGAAGTVTIDLAEADTASMAPGDYQYRLELTDAGGDVERFADGIFTLTPRGTVPAVP
jgi:hypothetical protein